MDAPSALPTALSARLLVLPDARVSLQVILKQLKPLLIAPWAPTTLTAMWKPRTSAL
jgi:hypothetical protein